METFDLFRNIVVTLVTLGLLTANPVTIIGVLRSRRLRDDVMTPVLISVFGADLCLGLYYGIITTIMSWMNIVDPAMWLVRLHAFYMFGPLANMMSVTMLAFLQTIAIVKPLQFTVIVTRRRVTLGLVILWIVSLGWGIWTASSDVYYYSPTRYSGNEGREIAVVLAFLLIILTACHIVIFITVIKQQIKMRTQTGAESAAPNAFLAAFKSAKRILAVTLTYLILYPIGTLATVFTSDPLARFLCMWLAYSQGILNSLFYMLFSKEVKKELRSLFCG